jgi:hypothetical protein
MSNQRFGYAPGRCNTPFSLEDSKNAATRKANQIYNTVCVAARLLRVRFSPFHHQFGIERECCYTSFYREDE